MRSLLFTGCVLVLFPSVPATPGQAASVPHRAPTPAPTMAPARRMAAASLYSRRSRRLVQSYLRLKVLEMRERDLERARKVVERKLGLKALLSETPAPDAR